MMPEFIILTLLLTCYVAGMLCLSFLICEMEMTLVTLISLLQRLSEH